MKSKWFRQRSLPIPATAKKNIQEIMQIEEQYLRQRSAMDRLGQFVSRAAGNVGFVPVYAAVFVTWISVNLGAIRGLAPFDPYPFSVLALLVALEAIFLSSFVLMAQNRQTRQADHWAHLNLQIGLLTEQETTKILQLLQATGNRLGLEKVAEDQELKEMVGKTAVGMLAEELAENLERTRGVEPSNNSPRAGT